MKDNVAAALRDMLGPAVGIGVSDPRDVTDGLWPEERADIVRAIPKRQHEFAAGRRAARQAMTALGLPVAAIPMGHQRAPIWPKGLAGSIAHCDTLCIAAISQTHQSIGIDIEHATPLDADLIAIVCTSAEQALLKHMPQAAQGMHCKRIFSAKEAVYKAQYPLTGQIIGFDALSVSMDRQDEFAATWHQPMPNLPSLRGSVRMLPNVILAVAVTTRGRPW